MLETIKDRAVQRRESDEGFTLIELLVVIVILAILAAIVVFAVGGIGNKGQESACSTDLKTIQTAQEAFFANQQPVGHYAGSLGELKNNGFLTEETNPLHSTNAAALPPAGDGHYEIHAVDAGRCPNSDYVSAPPTLTN